MNVFLADVEYSYQQTHSEYGNLEGGSVFAFVMEEDVRKAITKTEDAMRSMDLEVISFDSVFPYTGESADDEETEKQFLELAAAAKKDGEVQFADFYAYEHSGEMNPRANQ